MKRQTKIIRGALFATALSAFVYPSVIVKADVPAQNQTEYNVQTVANGNTKSELSSDESNYYQMLDDFKESCDNFDKTIESYYNNAYTTYLNALEENDSTSDELEELYDLYKESEGNVIAAKSELDECYKKMVEKYNSLTEKEQKDQEECQSNAVKDYEDRQKEASDKLKELYAPDVFYYYKASSVYSDSYDDVNSVIDSYYKAYKTYTDALEANDKSIDELKEIYELTREAEGNIKPVLAEFETAYKDLCAQHELLSDKAKDECNEDYSKLLKDYETVKEKIENMESFDAPDVYYYNVARSDFDNALEDFEEKYEECFGEDGTCAKYVKVFAEGVNVSDLNDAYKNVLVSYSKIDEAYKSLKAKYEVVKEKYADVDVENKEKCSGDFEDNFKKATDKFDEMIIMPEIKIAESTKVSISGNAPKVDVNSSVLEIYKKIDVTDEEAAILELGATVNVDLSVAEATPSETEKNLIKDALSGHTVGQYLDINVLLKINDSSRKVTDFTEPISLSVTIPDSMINKDATKERTYKIIRIHNGKASVIDGKFDASTGKFTFETDGFSTYAIVYKDTDVVKEQVKVEEKTQVNTTSPKTGDTTMTGLYVLMSVISGIALAGVVLVQRKKKDRI